MIDIKKKNATKIPSGTMFQQQMLVFVLDLDALKVAQNDLAE